MTVPTDIQVAAARARIAAAGLATNPIGEALIKFYPTDPTGTQHVNGTTVANMNTFSIKIDQQLNAKNLINGRVFYGRSFQSSPAGNSGEIVSPNQPVDLFNSVTDPTTATLAGLVWNSTLSDHALLEARVGFNRFWNPIVVNNSIDPNSLGINTGPLGAANFGVPAITTPFGNVGGIGGYPIFVTPSTDLSLAAIAHPDARSAHDQDRRQLGPYVQQKRSRPGAHVADGQRPDQRPCRRAGRDPAGAVRAGEPIVRFDRTQHDAEIRRRIHQRRLEDVTALYAQPRPAL